MSGTIWLIVEGQNDATIVKAILKRLYPHVNVRGLHPAGDKPNLSRLARQIERLIKQALDNRQHGDCIAVLYDADILTSPHHRTDYEHIKRVCHQYSKDVYIAQAEDEIESWLLADEGFCKWLNIKPENRDTAKQPSKLLQTLLDRAGKPKYRIEYLDKMLQFVDGNTHSESLKRELKYLAGTPCVKK